MQKIDKNFIDTNIDGLISITKEASTKVLSIYNKKEFKKEFKDDGSPLTEADLSANKIIYDGLIHTGIPIVSEETYNRNDPIHNIFWLVDPLDGTKEFVNRTGEFTVNIALIENKNNIFGIVGTPISEKIHFGSSFHNFENKADKSSKLRFIVSRSHLSNIENEFFKHLKEHDVDFELIEKGSSLKFCSLAENEADIYVRFGPTSEWDIAAAHAVLRSYGGEVLDLKTSEPLSYAKENEILNNPFVAFRNNSLKDKYFAFISEFYKKLL